CRRSRCARARRSIARRVRHHRASLRCVRNACYPPGDLRIRPQGMTVRIAHFTDIHVTARPADIHWRSLLGKRVVGWANLRFLGRAAASADCGPGIEAFVAALLDANPHHVLFTGDLTGLSLPSEFERAHKLLSPILDAFPCTGIPG